jgi:hypothetical protein
MDAPKLDASVQISSSDGAELSNWSVACPPRKRISTAASSSSTAANWPAGPIRRRTVIGWATTS